MSKWGDRPHWEYEATILGADDHGEWLGFPAGTQYSRPGHEFIGQRNHVGLVPAVVEGQRPWHLATFWAAAGDLGVPGSDVQIYVDATTPAEWEGDLLRAVDLDLDVVRRFDGSVFIDDEDEFLEHQVSFGYPADVIAAARASADEVRAAVEAGAAPYDGSHLLWLERLAELAT
ncbi:MAG: hypothetical protein JWN68_1356 [Nocardioides sp.]|jgi:hypothetical protein|nr:hypothetical protein [Nocardioides sp.]